jgi:hypothetical protein
MKVPASAIALSYWISTKALTVRMSVQGLVSRVLPVHTAVRNVREMKEDPSRSTIRC